MATIDPGAAPPDGFTEDDTALLCSAFTPELACQSLEDATDRIHASTLHGKTVEFSCPRHAPEEIWVAVARGGAPFRRSFQER